MSYSRRQLYALGEPLGDSATYRKADGGFILGDGGGGGSSQPANTTSTTTQTAELPEWARGYAKEALAKGQALTDVNQNPYQQYTQPRIAGFSPMQQQAMQQAQGMTVAPQIGAGTIAATGAGLGGLDVAGQANVKGFQGQVGGYMNPYLQMALAPQLAEANRQYDVGAAKQQSAATQAGAFGGSREAIMAAENERNRNMALQNIVGQGYNQAFQQAQNQYNQNLQNQLAGYGLTGQMAGQFGQLGQQQYQQGMGINQLQAQYGGQQQALQQQGLTQAYQDFINQQNYPYKQLGFMSDLIRGLPLGQQSTAAVYQPPPTTAQNISALGLGAYGIGQLFKGAAEGGEVKSYARGGDVDEIVTKLSDQQLQQALQSAMARGDAEQVRAVQEEMAMRASERGGLAGAYNQLPQETQESMASGGMVAFSDGGVPSFNGATTSSVGFELPTMKDYYRYLRQLGLSAQEIDATSLKKGYADFVETMKGTNRPTTPLENAIRSVGSAATGVKDYLGRGMGYLGKAAMPFSVFEGLYGTSDEELKTLKAADLKRATDAAIKAHQGPDAQSYDQNLFPVNLPDQPVAQGPAASINAPTGAPSGAPSGGGAGGGAGTGGTGGGSIGAGYMGQLANLAKEINKLEPTTIDRSKYIPKEIAERERAIGVNPALAEQEAMYQEGVQKGEDTLREGRGLAALAAIEGVLQPGGTLRGLAAGSKIFAEKYGQALKAKREEDKSLRLAKINMLNAQHQEKVGNYDAATRSYDTAQQFARLGDMYKLQKDSAMYTVIHGIGQLDLQGRQIAEMGKARAAAYEPGLVKLAEWFKSKNPNMTDMQAMDKAVATQNYSRDASLDLNRLKLVAKILEENPFYDVELAKLQKETDPEKIRQIQQRISDMENRARQRAGLPEGGGMQSGFNMPGFSIVGKRPD